MRLGTPLIVGCVMIASLVLVQAIAVERVMRRNLSVRAAAKELGISASSYLRVLRARQGAPVPSEAVAG